MPSSAYIKHVLQLSESHRKVCTPVVPAVMTIKKHRVQNVMMIVECPNRSMNKWNLQERCDNPEKFTKRVCDWLPVVHNKSEVYKNKYCALCNNVTTYEPIMLHYRGCTSEIFKLYIKRTLDGKPKVTLNNTLAKTWDCVIQGRTDMSVTYEKFQTCVIPRKRWEYNESSTICSKEEAVLCQSYGGGVTIARGQAFPNPTCALCRFPDVRVPNFSQCMDHLEALALMKGTLITPFSILMSFGDIPKVQLMEKDDVREELYCEGDLDWVNENCERMSNTSMKPPHIMKRLENTSNSTINCIFDQNKNKSPNKSLSEIKVLQDDIVCVEDDFPKTYASEYLYDWEASFSFAEDITSIIFLSMSILALVSTTMVYASCNELRTVRIQYLMMFFGTILLSDIIVLVGAVGKICAVCCKVIAICLHWLMLSSQLWTLFIVLDLAMMFKKIMTRRIWSNCQFVMINFAVWGVATIIVSICVCLDHFYPQLIQYGSNGVCWIGAKTAHIVTYLLPTLLAMLTSLVLIVLIIIEAKTRVDPQGSHPNNYEVYASLMLKIVLMFGCFEFVGLLQPGEQDESRKLASAIIRLIGSSLRSFRGVFVFCVFVLKNRRARQVLLGTGRNR